MNAESGKGAIASNNGAQEGERSELILLSTLRPVKDEKSLARAIRRKLKPHGETIRKIGDSYYVVDVQDWHRIDLGNLATRLNVAISTGELTRVARVLGENGIDVRSS
jgi:hypothetical protein